MKINAFSINDYKAEFVRFFVTPEEVIYCFVDIVRINRAMISGFIFRSDHIIVAKEYISDFLEFTKDLNIYFLDSNGKIVCPNQDDVGYTAESGKIASNEDE